MVHIENLVKQFHTSKGLLTAVDNISFSCKKGKIVGLLGPNGAGKTTTLRIVATILKPTAGEVIVNGYNVAKQPEKVRALIGFLTGETKLYDRLTPRETLKYFSRLYELPDDEIEHRIELLTNLLDLTSVMDTRYEKLSEGTQQRVSIARVLLHNPPIFILDEPTSGLDILARKEIISFIKQLRSQGKCILLSTHILWEAEQLCDEIVIIHKGRILDSGTLEELTDTHKMNTLEEIFTQLVKNDTKIAS